MIQNIIYYQLSIVFQLLFNKQNKIYLFNFYFMDQIDVSKVNNTFNKETEKLEVNQDDKSDRDSVLSPIKTKMFDHKDGTQSNLTSMKMSVDDNQRRNQEDTPQTVERLVPEQSRKDTTKTVKKIISLNNFQVIDNEGPFNTEGKRLETLKHSPQGQSGDISKNETPIGPDGQPMLLTLSQTMRKQIKSPINIANNEESDFKENDTDYDGDNIVILNAGRGELDKMRNTERHLKINGQKMGIGQGTITPNDGQIQKDKSSQNSSFYDRGPQQVKISEAYALELSPSAVQAGQESSNLGLTNRVILENKFERAGHESMETNKLTPYSGAEQFSANYSKQEERKFGVAEKDLIQLQNQEKNSDLTAVLEGNTPLKSSALSNPMIRQNRQITTVFKTSPGISFEKKDIQNENQNSKQITNPDEDPSFLPNSLVFATKDEGSFESQVQDKSALSRQRQQELMLIQENLVARHILKKSPRTKGHFKAQPVIIPDIAMGVVGQGLSSMNSRNDPNIAVIQSMTPVMINSGLVSKESTQRNKTRETMSQMRQNQTNPSVMASKQDSLTPAQVYKQLQGESDSSIQPSGEGDSSRQFASPSLNPKHKMGMNLTRITEFQNEIATPHENTQKSKHENMIRNTKYSQGFDLGTGQDNGSIIEIDEQNKQLHVEPSQGNEIGQVTLEKKSNMTIDKPVDKSVAGSTTQSMQNALNNVIMYGQQFAQNNPNVPTTTSDYDQSKEMTLGNPSLGDAYFVDPTRKVTYRQGDPNSTHKIQLGVDLNQIHQVNKYGHSQDHFLNQPSDKNRSPNASPTGFISPLTSNTTAQMSLLHTKRASNKRFISPGSTNSTGFENSFYIGGQKSRMDTSQSPKSLQKKKFHINNTARRQDYLSFITQQKKEASFVEQLKKYREDQSVEQTVGQLYQDTKNFMIQGNIKQLTKERALSPEMRRTLAQKRYKDEPKKDSNEDKSFKRSLSPSPSQRAESNCDLQHIPEFTGNKKSKIKLTGRPYEGDSSGIGHSAITPDNHLNPARIQRDNSHFSTMVKSLKDQDRNAKGDNNENIYQSFASPSIEQNQMNQTKRTPVILKSQKTMSNLGVDKNFTQTNQTPLQEHRTRSDLKEQKDDLSKGIENNMAVVSDDSQSIGDQNQRKSSINTLPQNSSPSGYQQQGIISPINVPPIQNDMTIPSKDGSTIQLNMVPVTDGSRMMMIQSQFPPQLDSNTNKH